MANPPKAWKVEYTKSGRSSCQSCKSNIAKEALRLGKMVQSTQFDGFMHETIYTNRDVLYHLVSWTFSSDESWRINFAGTFANGSKYAGAGCILRDHNAKFKGACAVPVMNCNSLLEAELVGLKHGLVMAIEQGVDYLEIDGDYWTAIRVLLGEASSPSYISELVTHCFDLLQQFRIVKIREVGISFNRGANKVAAMGIGLKEPRQWLDEPPSQISEMLIDDVIGRWIY